MIIEIIIEAIFFSLNVYLNLNCALYKTQFKIFLFIVQISEVHYLSFLFFTILATLFGVLFRASVCLQMTDGVTLFAFWSIRLESQFYVLRL